MPHYVCNKDRVNGIMPNLTSNERDMIMVNTLKAIALAAVLAAAAAGPSVADVNSCADNSASNWRSAVFMFDASCSSNDGSDSET